MSLVIPETIREQSLARRVTNYDDGTTLTHYLSNKETPSLLAMEESRPDGCQRWTLCSQLGSLPFQLELTYRDGQLLDAGISVYREDVDDFTPWRMAQGSVRPHGINRAICTLDTERVGLYDQTLLSLFNGESEYDALVAERILKRLAMGNLKHASPHLWNLSGECQRALPSHILPVTAGVGVALVAVGCSDSDSSSAEQYKAEIQDQDASVELPGWESVAHAPVHTLINGVQTEGEILVYGVEPQYAGGLHLTISGHGSGFISSQDQMTPSAVSAIYRNLGLTIPQYLTGISISPIDLGSTDGSWFSVEGQGPALIEALKGRGVSNFESVFPSGITIMSHSAGVTTAYEVASSLVGAGYTGQITILATAPATERAYDGTRELWREAFDSGVSGEDIFDTEGPALRSLIALLKVNPNVSVRIITVKGEEDTVKVVKNGSLHTLYQNIIDVNGNSMRIVLENWEDLENTGHDFDQIMQAIKVR